MRTPDHLFFGTAGIPNSTPKPSTLNGLKRIHELGLSAMEIEFVRGVKMSEGTAHEVYNTAKDLGILLTVHAPYYINLLSSESDKVEASIKRIIDSARMGYLAGAWSVVFHSGYYGNLPSSECIKKVRNSIKVIINKLIDEGIEIWVRPEVMGGLAEFGSIDEVLAVTEGIEYSLPCIDFAHIYARSRGKVNNYEEFKKILEQVENKLGTEAVKNSHIHLSGMEYGNRGEVKHLNLTESRINYQEIIKVIKDFKVSGVLISESPNLEVDALLMLNAYTNA
ncbi:MAG: TIM barrel protein [Sulfolobales archaeon]|nr:TIM barrel protein [Sulfolobales archaeon]MDW7969091.1 TIM barrel protein [Sulfolobales archaeon]